MRKNEEKKIYGINRQQSKKYRLEWNNSYRVCECVCSICLCGFDVHIAFFFLRRWRENFIVFHMCNGDMVITIMLFSHQWLILSVLRNGKFSLFFFSISFRCICTKKFTWDFAICWNVIKSLTWLFVSVDNGGKQKQYRRLHSVMRQFITKQVPLWNGKQQREQTTRKKCISI